MYIKNVQVYFNLQGYILCMVDKTVVMFITIKALDGIHKYMSINRQGTNRVHYNQFIMLGQFINFILSISHNFYFTMMTE